MSTKIEHARLETSSDAATDGDDANSSKSFLPVRREMPYRWESSNDETQLSSSRLSAEAARWVRELFAAEAGENPARMERLVDGRFGISRSVEGPRIALAQTSSAFSYLDLDRANLRFGFRLARASESNLEQSGNHYVYPNALGIGQHAVLRLGSEVVEDFVVFSVAPARAAVDYELDVSSLSGIRLVPDSDTIEFLDESGAPRSRMQKAVIRDRTGRYFEVRTELAECEVDRDPRPPIDREFLRLHSQTCIVKLTWDPTGIVYPAVLDPTWSPTGLMGSPRAHHIAELLDDGRVLVAGGFNLGWGTNTTLRATELYVPSTNAWITVGSLRLARQSGGAAKIQNGSRKGQVFLFGGNTNFIYVEGTRSTTEIYNPITATWSDGPRMAFTRMRPRIKALADGRILIDGGRGSRTFPSLVDADGTINVGCGTDSCVCGPMPWPGLGPQDCAQFRTEVYDPDANTITTVPSLHIHPRDNHNLELVDPNNILAFGVNDETASYKLERFNIPSLSWSALPNTADIHFTSNVFPARNQIESAQSVVLPSGEIFLIENGKNTELGDESATWDPTSERWTLRAMLPTPNYFMASQAATNFGAVLLSGNRIFIAPKDAGNRAQLFSMASGTFSNFGGALLYPHAGGTVTVLSDQRVLLAGGTNGAGTPHNHAEVLVECLSSLDCASPTPFCASCGRCVECTNNSQCPASRPICDSNSNKCVACATSSDCSSPTQSRCDVRTRSCMSPYSTLSTTTCSACFTQCRNALDRPYLGLGRDVRTRYSASLVVDSANQGIAVQCGVNACN